MERSVKILFYIAVLGQIAFAIYMFIHFGLSAFKEKWEVWDAGLMNGFIEGDFLGNMALIMHIMLAFIITLGGPLQFIPYFRKKGSSFHRWNGRIHIITAILISAGALYLVWSRSEHLGGLYARIAVSSNGLLIIVFAIMTWITAIQGKFDIHRKWAIRTYIVVCGVWFIRIGYGTWFLITGFTVPGVSEDMTGPFDRFLSFGSYLIPLLFTEAYFYIQEYGSERLKHNLRIPIYLLCMILIGGTAVTARVFWFG
jgi:hypothetical protein